MVWLLSAAAGHSLKLIQHAVVLFEQSIMLGNEDREEERLFHSGPSLHLEPLALC